MECSNILAMIDICAAFVLAPKAQVSYRKEQCDVMVTF